MLMPSILRTVVPLLAGWAITVLTGLGLSADSTAITAGVTAAVTTGYYLVFRLVERGVEKLGGPAWLQALAGIALGYARPPQYQPTDDIEALARQTR